MDTEIGPRGYSIPLKQLPAHFLEDIRSELNVKPLENPNFQSSGKSFPVYRISKTKVYLPRYYGIERYGIPRSICLEGHTFIDIPFQGTLRPVQQEAIDATLPIFEKNYGGLLSLGTGTGKTTIALYLTSFLKVKTLILVHAEFLLEQWIERIQQYLPTARVGIIRQNKCEVEDTDICVGMIQTIIKREYPKDFFKSFGLLTVDECFPGDTPLLTVEGVLTIGKIYELWKNDSYIPEVLSYNLETNIIESKKITYAWEKKGKELLKFYYSEEESFRCTPTHKILTYHGYLPANEICVGDYINTGYGFSRIDFIEPVENESEFVYDIEVQDNHNFKLAYGGPIVHNCHHIASETFSSIFYKVQTRYHLGLSATLDRKDGLTKVINWFIGPVIIDITKTDIIPSVKFLFNETAGYEEKYNKLGKINLPIMITDLTLKEGRNQLIIQTINQLIEKGRKILVLTDRRDHCGLLYKMLPEGVSGQYVGGMKTLDRKSSTEQKVIIGTYQASGEGFDVPDLDTLILATPKSDITQAIGRILRQKNPNEPLVIDIVDSFSVFKGQYYKRRKYYKNNNIPFN
jgi:superfamily II DNA or RNA helicase